VERVTRAESQNLHTTASFKFILKQMAWTFQLVIDKNIWKKTIIGIDI
jgi:hypothetical protein